MKIVAVAALATLTTFLAGCAGNTSGSTNPARLVPYSGDQNGGKIPNGFNNVPAAMSTARVHCAKYNKKAIVTQMDTAAAGGLVAFQCL